MLKQIEIKNLYTLEDKRIIDLNFENWAKLVSFIKIYEKNKQIEPIIVYPKSNIDYYVIDGVKRCWALNKLKQPTVFCYVIPNQYNIPELKFLRENLNTIYGSPDYQKLSKILGEFDNLLSLNHLPEFNSAYHLAKEFSESLNIDTPEIKITTTNAQIQTVDDNNLVLKFKFAFKDDTHTVEIIVDRYKFKHLIMKLFGEYSEKTLNQFLILLSTGEDFV